MSDVNLTIWIGSLALQMLLVSILFMRGLARRVSLFTLLLLFYIARSVLLFLLPRYVSHETFGDWYEILSYLDLALELLIATGVVIFILRRTGKQTSLSMVAAAGILIAGVALAFLVAMALPSVGPVPLDRGMAFIAALMLILSVWAALSRIRGPWIRIAQGFAVYGIGATSAGLLKSQAALRRNTHLFAIGVYGQAAVYLAVVVFWIFAIRAQPAGSPDR